jgi:hypothetical protein
VLLLLALMSQVGFGSAEALRCSMHGLGAALSEGGAPAGAMMHHQAATHHGDSDKGSGGCHCTCIGDCSAAIALPAAPSAPTLRVAPVAAKPRRPLDTAAARPTRPEPDRLLPFANGPPATALL